VLGNGPLERKKEDIKNPVKNIEIQILTGKNLFNHFFVHIKMVYVLYSKIVSNSLNNILIIQNAVKFRYMYMNNIFCQNPVENIKQFVQPHISAV